MNAWNKVLVTAIAACALVVSAGCDSDDSTGSGVDAGPVGGGDGAGGQGGSVTGGGEGGASGGNTGGDTGGGEGGAGGGAVGGAGGGDVGGAGGGDPIGTDCASQCGRFADCATDPNICPNFPPAVRPQLNDGCAMSCDAQVAGGLAQQATCEDVVDFVISISDPAFAEQCGREPAGPSPNVPECDAFAGRIMACAVEACAAASAVEDAFGSVLADQCDDLIAGGQATPAQIGATVNETTPCGSASVQQIVGLLIDRNPQDGTDGPLKTLCTTGPATDPVVCEAACENIDPCEEAGALADPEVCVAECILNPMGTAAFTCASHLEDCDAISMAFATDTCDGAGGAGGAGAGGATGGAGGMAAAGGAGGMAAGGAGGQ